MVPSIGINEFYVKNHVSTRTNSCTCMSNYQLIELVKKFWDTRVKGDGELDLSRKVLVSPPASLYRASFFTPLRARLVPDMPIQSVIESRIEGEEPYITNYVTWGDARVYDALITPETNSIKLVVYSKEALLENGGVANTGCEWEIITLLCSSDEYEPMPPLTMARNQLEKKGGTYGEYSALEYADSIWYHSTKKGIPVRDSKI